MIEINKFILFLYSDFFEKSNFIPKNSKNFLTYFNNLKFYFYNIYQI